MSINKILERQKIFENSQKLVEEKPKIIPKKLKMNIFEEKIQKNKKENINNKSSFKEKITISNNFKNRLSIFTSNPKKKENEKKDEYIPKRIF